MQPFQYFQIVNLVDCLSSWYKFITNNHTGASSRTLLSVNVIWSISTNVSERPAASTEALFLCTDVHGLMSQKSVNLIPLNNIRLQYKVLFLRAVQFFMVFMKTVMYFASYSVGL